MLHDPSMPYLVKLSSGRSIAVFFYDAPLAQAVAFEKLLMDGKRFAGRLLGAFDDGRNHDQLRAYRYGCSESYGHHFKYGDMALAYALHEIEKSDHAKLTVYGEFLEKHPPTYEVEIPPRQRLELFLHGVGRWKRKLRLQFRTAPAGIRNGAHPCGMRWTGCVIDWPRFLRARERNSSRDPWLARDEYISGHPRPFPGKHR